MAAVDILAVGPYIFTDFAVPAELPIGGRQQVKLHKMPGGDRAVDAMGPDDADRTFEFTIVGTTAVSDVQLLDTMRQSGSLWPYSNGVEARLVIITEFTAKFEKINVAHCHLTLTPIDNPAGSSASTAPASADTLVSSDFSAASTTAAANVTAQTVTTAGFGHA